MNRETLDSLDKETLIRLILSQVEAIECLTREVEALRADNAKLHADNAALRAKLNLPPKTPENSSTPPSQGNKVSVEESKSRAPLFCRLPLPLGRRRAGTMKIVTFTRTSEGKRRKPHAR